MLRVNGNDFKFSHVMGFDANESRYSFFRIDVVDNTDHTILKSLYNDILPSINLYVHLTVLTENTMLVQIGSSVTLPDDPIFIDKYDNTYDISDKTINIVLNLCDMYNNKQITHINTKDNVLFNPDIFNSDKVRIYSWGSLKYSLKIINSEIYVDTQTSGIGVDIIYSDDRRYYGDFTHILYSNELFEMLYSKDKYATDIQLTHLVINASFICHYFGYNNDTFTNAHMEYLNNMTKKKTSINPNGNLYYLLKNKLEGGNIMIRELNTFENIINNYNIKNDIGTSYMIQDVLLNLINPRSIKIPKNSMIRIVSTYNHMVNNSNWIPNAYPPPLTHIECISYEGVTPNYNILLINNVLNVHWSYDDYIKYQDTNNYNRYEIISPTDTIKSNIVTIIESKLIFDGEDDEYCYFHVVNLDNYPGNLYDNYIVIYVDKKKTLIFLKHILPLSLIN